MGSILRAVTITVLVATAACSGADPNNLLGGDGGDAPNVDAGVTPADDATSPPPPGPDAGEAPDGTVAQPDGQSQVDANPDVHTGPADSQIDCGPTVKCSAQNQICCHHAGSTNNPYECVTSASSCAAIDDVPISCSSVANCASQGNPTYMCCATGGGLGTGQCYSYDIAVSAQCKPDCTSSPDDYEIGCSLQQQNCSDSMQTCIVSKCTLPGYTMCY